MEIIIKSRNAIEALAKEPFMKRTALISITDYGWTFPELAFKPEHCIQLEFDDVDSDVFEDELGRVPTKQERAKMEAKYYMLTDKQARDIAEFYHNIREDTDVIICQCEHGQSRSAAVAAAIMEFEHRRGIEIFASDSYYPNKLVFRKILKALRDNT